MDFYYVGCRKLLGELREPLTIETIIVAIVVKK